MWIRSAATVDQVRWMTDQPHLLKNIKRGQPVNLNRQNYNTNPDLVTLPYFELNCNVEDLMDT